jgi:hypothetical protein
MKHESALGLNLTEKKTIRAASKVMSEVVREAA